MSSLFLPPMPYDPHAPPVLRPVFIFLGFSLLHRDPIPHPLPTFSVFYAHITFAEQDHILHSTNRRKRTLVRRPSLHLCPRLARPSSSNRLLQSASTRKLVRLLVLSTKRVQRLHSVDPHLHERRKTRQLEEVRSVSLPERDDKEREMEGRENGAEGRTIQFSDVNASSNTSSVGDSGMSCCRTRSTVR